MRLPNLKEAVVSESKVRDYLLDLSHRVGGAKARFFLQFGFHRDRWEVLANALLQHAQANDVAKVEEREYGSTYIVDGPFPSPSGTILNLRSVWYIDAGTVAPRLISAYPLPRT